VRWGLFDCDRTVFGFNGDRLLIVIADGIFAADDLDFGFARSVVLYFEIQIR